MSEERKRTALVTGASSGIGHALAIELSKRGFKVFACARRLEPMRDLESEHGVTIFQIDVSSLESINNGVKFIDSQLGVDEGAKNLDLLYNNAGQSCTFPAIDVPDEALTQCLDVNFIGPVRLTHAFRSYVINAKGVIAFTGSLAGICPFPWGAVYGASKAAIHQYASTLSFEMEPFGVRVLNVVTGGVKTNIADTRDLPQNSPYNCPEMTDSITRRRRMAERETPMSAEVYAKKVVDDVLYGDSFINHFTRRVNVYHGSWSTRLSLLMNIAPRWLVLYAFRIRFKLNGVFEAIRARQEKSKQT
ncbi:hypothetical protein V1508DRAFT_427032 [Lipomyces doorenjongii]|uniref:uncharacterized protein n=1 Tax=Lipomyces doorenjongii TaxID=383834 RepID=UPI0034CD7DD7